MSVKMYDRVMYGLTGLFVIGVAVVVVGVIAGLVSG